MSTTSTPLIRVFAHVPRTFTLPHFASPDANDCIEWSADILNPERNQAELLQAQMQASQIEALPELIDACRNAMEQLKTVAAITNHLPKKYAAELSAIVKWGDLETLLAKVAPEEKA
jgi:hypothetical protein